MSKVVMCLTLVVSVIVKRDVASATKFVEIQSL